ncbi:Rv1733c family protein [Salinifilum ghardaiensis]
MAAAWREELAWLRNALRSDNPLCRRVDRVVAWLTALFATAALLAAPAVAVAAAEVHRDLERQAAATVRTAQPVQAVLTSQPRMQSPAGNGYYQQSAKATVRWHTGASTSTSTVDVPLDLSRGDTVRVWVDRSGDRVTPPMSPPTRGVVAALTGVLLWVLAVLVCWFSARMCQVVGRRHAARFWDHEWHRWQCGGA